MSGFRKLLLSIGLTICVAFAPPASARWKKTVPVVFFGDSIGAGYGLFDPKDALPFRLERDISSAYIDFKMINKSVAGDTTASALTRMKDVLAAGPKIVIIELGGNDALRGVDPDIVYNNMEIILREMARNGIYVLLCGMKAPMNMGYDYRTRFDRIFPVLAERANVNFYPFLLDGVIDNRLFLQRDGIHPSKEGIAHISERLGPYVSKMVLNIIYANDRLRLKMANEQMKRRKGKGPVAPEDGVYSGPSDTGAAPIPGQ